MRQWMKGQNKSWTKPETENMSKRERERDCFSKPNELRCTFIRKPKECDSYLNIFNQGKEWL